MVLIAIILALLAFVGWLVWPGAGIGLTWASAPGGPISLRVRRRSLLPRLLGSDGCAVLGVVHIAGATVSPYLLAHECCHVIRAKRSPVGYLLRYLTSGSFRAREEQECTTFGLEWRTSSWMISRAQLLSGGGQ